MTLINKIPPHLPLPSGSETALGRRPKGVPRFAGFGKEGLAPWSGESYSTGQGEIF